MGQGSGKDIHIMGKDLNMLVKILEAENLIIEVSESARGVCVEGITDNSKQTENGSLFVCKGAAFKAEYLGEAIDRGTAAYISEIRYTEAVPYLIVSDIRRAMALAGRWFYDFAGDSLTKVGVTGTKGKTSCVTILSDVMRAHGREVAEFTTHSIRIGSRERESALTTPEPLELQEYFREAVDSGIDCVAMEISSQAMKMNRVYGERYRVGIFLNIEEDHISPAEHADMDEYLACKVAMFRQCDTVIINRDTNMYDRVRKAVPEGVKVILFGQKRYDHDQADARIGNVQMGMSGLTFDISYRGRTDTIHTNLVGRFNVENITAAALAAVELGISMDKVKNAVQELFIPGRLNIVEVSGRHVIIDYAHNHMSYDRLFRTVRSIYPTARLTAMVGAVGDKAFGRRREAGQMTDVYADQVVITEQDSGGEHTAKIGSEIARYVHKPCKIVPRREAAIRYILDKSDPGDVIVLTGKGAEKTLRVGKNSVRPYAGDLEIVKSWLQTELTIDAK